MQEDKIEDCDGDGDRDDGDANIVFLQSDAEKNLMENNGENEEEVEPSYVR